MEPTNPQLDFSSDLKKMSNAGNGIIKSTYRGANKAGRTRADVDRDLAENVREMGTRSDVGGDMSVQYANKLYEEHGIEHPVSGDALARAKKGEPAKFIKGGRPAAGKIAGKKKGK